MTSPNSKENKNIETINQHMHQYDGNVGPINRHSIVRRHIDTSAKYVKCTKCVGYGENPDVDPRCRFGCDRVISLPPNYTTPGPYTGTHASTTLSPEDEEEEDERLDGILQRSQRSPDGFLNDTPARVGVFSADVSPSLPTEYTEIEHAPKFSAGDKLIHIKQKEYKSQISEADDDAASKTLTGESRSRTFQGAPAVTKHYSLLATIALCMLVLLAVPVYVLISARIQRRKKLVQFRVSFEMPEGRQIDFV